MYIGLFLIVYCGVLRDPSKGLYNLSSSNLDIVSYFGAN